MPTLSLATLSRMNQVRLFDVCPLAPYSIAPAALRLYYSAMLNSGPSSALTIGAAESKWLTAYYSNFRFFTRSFHASSTVAAVDASALPMPEATRMQETDWGALMRAFNARIANMDTAHDNPRKRKRLEYMEGSDSADDTRSSELMTGRMAEQIVGQLRCIRNIDCPWEQCDMTLTEGRPLHLLVEHYRSRHTSEPWDYCAKCRRAFTSRARLENHTDSHVCNLTAKRTKRTTKHQPTSEFELAQQPAASPQQPAASPQQPAASPQQPAASPQQPAASPQQPAASLQQPAASLQQPAASLQQPAASLQQHSGSPQPSGSPQQDVKHNTPEKPKTLDDNVPMSDIETDGTSFAAFVRWLTQQPTYSMALQQDKS